MNEIDRVKKVNKWISNIIDFEGEHLSIGTFETLKDIKNEVYLLSQLSGECIASGELNYVNRGYTILCVGFKGKYVPGVKLDKYMGKEIKMFIQECKK